MNLLNIRLVFILLFVVQISYAQQSAKYSYSLGAEVSKGIIHRHHEYIGQLIKGMPTSIELSFRKKTFGANSWEANYNYPDIDFKISYFDLKNKEQLGNVVAASTGMSFHLLGRPSLKNELQFYFGLGLAYSTNPYNKDFNNLNNVISSAVSFNGNLRFSYHHQFGNRLNAGLGLKVTHFSNGSAKLPNNGLNIVSVDVMAIYKLSPVNPEYMPVSLDQSIDKKIRYGAVVRMGWSESTPAGSGVKPVYNIGIIAQKRVSIKSLLDAGIEGFANKAVEYEITHGHSFDGDTLDYRRVGLMVGHELLVNKLTFVTQLGYYLYKPYYPKDRIYARIGLNYYFTDRIYGGINLKTHYAVAEVIDYNIGFRF